MRSATLILNSGQRKAAATILTHWRKGKPHVLLTGAAGTGKTTLAGYLAAKMPGNTVGLSRTPAQARALGKVLPCPAYTLEQFVGAECTGYRPNGQPIYDYGNRLKNMAPPELIVMDEMSALEQAAYPQLLGMVLDYAVMHGIHTLLTADPGLLQSGQEAGISTLLPKIPRVHLEQVERSRQPDLVALAEHLRERWNDSNPLKGAQPRWISKDRCGWQYAQVDQLPGLHTALGEAAILVFTSQAVARHNRSVRLHRKGRLGIPPFDEGDRLIGCPNRKARLGEATTFAISASWTYQVTSISERVQHYAIPGYWVDLQITEDGPMRRVFVVPAMEDLSRRMFARQCAHRYDQTRKRVEETGDTDLWEAFHAWRDAFALLGDASEHPYARSDLDYAYALTTAQAQGASFDYVLLDGSDLERIRAQQGNECANRLLYVAVCRARRGVLIGR